MADKETLNVKTMVVYGLIVVIVAFVGVLAGNWFVQWRQDRSMAPTPDNWKIYNQTALLEGDAFPAEDLLDLDSNTVNAGQLVDGHMTLILFIAPGCEPCALAIESWKDEADEIPSDITVFGIAVGEVNEVQKYRKKAGFPFAIYSDPLYMYAQQYDLSTFPTMLGLDEQGKVTFLMPGYHEGLKLRDVYDYMVEYNAGN